MVHEFRGHRVENEEDPGGLYFRQHLHHAPRVRARHEKERGRRNGLFPNYFIKTFNYEFQLFRRYCSKFFSKAFDR